MKPSVIAGPWRSASRSEPRGAHTPRRSRPALRPVSSDDTPASAINATRSLRVGAAGSVMVRGAGGVVVVMRGGVDLGPLVAVEPEGSGWEEAVVLLVDVRAQRVLEGVHERVVAGRDGRQQLVEGAVLATESIDVTRELVAALHHREEAHLLGLRVRPEEMGEVAGARRHVSTVDDGAAQLHALTISTCSFMNRPMTVIESHPQ